MNLNKLFVASICILTFGSSLIVPSANIQTVQATAVDERTANNEEPHDVTTSVDIINESTSDTTLYSAPLVRIAPDPTGSWVQASTLKYKINPSKDIQTFAASAAGYLFLSSLAGKAASAIATGLVSVFSSNIKGKDIWVTVRREKKEGRYVLLSRQHMTFYSNAARTKRITSVTITARFVKDTKFARRSKITRSESPISSVY